MNIPLEHIGTMDLIEELNKRHTFKGFVCFNERTVNNANPWKEVGDFSIKGNLVPEDIKILTDHFSKVIEENYL
jgi:hypothetical protein